MADGRDAEGMEALEIELGLREDPAEIARQQLREHQEATGMTFEDPDAPVAAHGDPFGQVMGDPEQDEEAGISWEM